MAQNTSPEVLSMNFAPPSARSLDPTSQTHHHSAKGAIEANGTPQEVDGHRSGHVEEQAPQKQGHAPSAGPDPSQFPDGGSKAWLCVAGGFCCAFCSFGWANAIGVFQEFYQRQLLSSYSPSAISWIVSLETFFMFVGAPVVGMLYDNFGPKRIVITGTFLHVFGVMMTSLCTEYYQLILAQGVCSPLGASAVLYPAMSTVISWFHKKRGLALGVMVSGSSLGGVIFPILVQNLIPRMGFPWTMRASAFLILALLAFASATVRSRIPPKPRPFSAMDFVRPFGEPAFATVSAGNFFGFLALFIPFNYVTLSAISLGMSIDLSNYLISILNLGSIFGRIFPGWAADRLGRYNIQIVMCTVSFIVNLAIWLPARGNAPIVVFAVLYGFASGTFVSLAPAVITQITTDMSQIGTRTGSMFALVSVAALIGNPIAGTLLGRDDGRYEYLQVFTGVAIAAATAFFVLSKSLNKGKFLKKF